MPFDTTTLIPAGWSQHHQPVVVGAMNATVTITDPARTIPGRYNPDTGYHDPDTPYVVAVDVPCRIQRQRDDRAVDHAAQNVTIRLYLLQFPADVPDIEVGYEATVLACPNDAHFVGETLTASDVMHGSERFTRDIAWVHNQAPRTPQEG